jgi:hypothetical protein
MIIPKHAVLLSIITSFCALCPPIALPGTHGGSDQVGDCFGNIFEIYIKSRLNRLPNPIVKVDGAKPLEALFHELDISTFTYAEKKQLAFMVAVAIPSLDAANADSFRYFLRPDAARIANDLEKFSDTDLATYLLFSPERTKSYRAFIESLKAKE